MLLQVGQTVVLGELGCLGVSRLKGKRRGRVTYIVALWTEGAGRVRETGAESNFKVSRSSKSYDGSADGDRG